MSFSGLDSHPISMSTSQFRSLASSAEFGFKFGPDVPDPNFEEEINFDLDHEEVCFVFVYILFCLLFLLKRLKCNFYNCFKF